MRIKLNKYKIAYVVDALYPIKGGVQTHIYNITRELIKIDSNMEIDIFCRYIISDNDRIHTVENLSNNVRIIRYGSGSTYNNFYAQMFSYVSFIITFAKYNNREKYLLVHGHAFTGMLQAALVKSLFGKKNIATVHGVGELEYGGSFVSRMLASIVFLKLHYNSAISVGFGVKKYSKKYVIIPNGIDQEKFLVKRTVINNNRKIQFMFLGRYNDPAKGLKYLIETVKIIKEELLLNLINKKIEFTLMGYGEKKYLTDMVKKYGLEDLIKFKNGYVDTNIIVNEMANSDVFILPSIFEGDPIVLKEAWAAGLPVLVTRCNASEYIVINEKNGWIVNAGDSVALAQKIIEVVNLDKKRLIEMGNSGRELVKNYTWEVCAKAVYEIYSKHMPYK